MTENSVKNDLGIGQETSVICIFINTELSAYSITLYFIFCNYYPLHYTIPSQRVLLKPYNFRQPMTGSCHIVK